MASINEKGRIAIQTRITKAMYDKLVEACKKEDRSMSYFISMMISEKLGVK